jgi:hypothetical protein
MVLNAKALQAEKVDVEEEADPWPLPYYYDLIHITIVYICSSNKLFIFWSSVRVDRYKLCIFNLIYNRASMQSKR